MLEPSHSYFEVFVHERNGEGNISGTIEDTLGTAKFEGNLGKDEISFVKRYTECSQDAIKESLTYRAKKVGNEFFGHYRSSIGSGPFYLVESSRSNPVDMSVRWDTLSQ